MMMYEDTDFGSVIRRHDFDHILRNTIFEAVGIFEVLFVSR